MGFRVGFRIVGMSARGLGFEEFKDESPLE